jgi:hypothetical protein
MRDRRSAERWKLPGVNMQQVIYRAWLFNNDLGRSHVNHRSNSPFRRKFFYFPCSFTNERWAIEKCSFLARVKWNLIYLIVSLGRRNMWFKAAQYWTKSSHSRARPPISSCFISSRIIKWVSFNGKFFLVVM